MTEGTPAEVDEMRQQVRGHAGGGAAATEDGDGLSREDAGLLLSAFRDLLNEVREGEIDADELRDRLERLLSSLDRAPGPRALQDESLELLRSWSEVWIEELAAGRSSEAASVRSLLVAELSRLSRLMDEGV